MTNSISLTKLVKITLLEGIKQFDASKGIGGNTYFKPKTIHPMAEAKFLEALLSLRNCSIISESRHKTYATGALKRLRQTSVKTSEGISWGLNFSWLAHNYKKTEPLLINSAMVCGALSWTEALGLSANDLSAEAESGLSYWCNKETEKSKKANF